MAVGDNGGCVFTSNSRPLHPGFIGPAYDGRTLMKTNWFARWGWFYRPIHLVGYAATLIAIAFCAQTFVAIDRHSHSVSDTLYHFYPFVAPTFLGLMWLAARTSRATSV